MDYKIGEIIGNIIMTAIPTVRGLTKLYKIENRLGTGNFDRLRDAGWAILSS